jgi:hypothetical protein
MPCPLFRQVDKGMGLCDAVRDDHIPTVLERERYCCKDGGGCPVLAGYEARGRRLSLMECLDTWSRPPARPPERVELLGEHATD